MLGPTVVTGSTMFPDGIHSNKRLQVRFTLILDFTVGLGSIGTHLPELNGLWETIYLTSVPNGIGLCNSRSSALVFGSKRVII